MIKYAYAQLFTYLRDSSYRTAAFVDSDGRSQEWTAENYDVIHLSRAAADGWRVINVQTDSEEGVAYLLERQISSRP
ncbi:hypothetical protein ACQEUX_24210 [Micromonospora sp. CA-259024]|uniref:hypothetical protein n=1 Tax=Micromonospora sp. CA-259024 TaxID=3239965 RepID=UPI003D8E72FA